MVPTKEEMRKLQIYFHIKRHFLQSKKISYFVNIDYFL